MKRRFFSILGLPLFFLSFSTFAQGILVSGIIKDAHTKEPLNNASVYLLKSGIGKTSDSAGAFSFRSNISEEDTLIVSYIGYENFTMQVSHIKDSIYAIIELRRGGGNNGVTVKSKINKGLFLWRKIMSKKKVYNRYDFSNFGYEAYNKLEIDIKNFDPDVFKKKLPLRPFSFIFDMLPRMSEKEPFVPAYLIESLSDYAWQQSPAKTYENIKATNTRGFKYVNESVSSLLGVTGQNVNIYSNFIKVTDKDFVSPFHDNADTYYSFDVPDTQLVGGKKLFHFVFRPKHVGQNVFEGDAWVVERTFQIQKISLYLGKDANINYIDRISVFQEFAPVNDSIYFLLRDKFFADFKVLGKKSLLLIGRKSTSYKDVVINSDSITTLFNGQATPEAIKTDTGYTNHSDSAWRMLRHDTLSKNERAIYATIDTLQKMPKYERLQNTFKFLGSGYLKTGNYDIGRWFNWFSRNQWEGSRFRFDVGTNQGFNRNILLHGYVAYGSTDKKFKGKAEAYWIAKRKPKWVRFHLLYLNDIDNGVSSYGDLSQDNLFSLAIRKRNIGRRFIQVKNVAFEVFNELGNGFSTEWFVNRREYNPLRNLPLKSTLASGDPNVLTNFELALKLRFAYAERFLEGDYFRRSLGTKYPVAEILAAKGISNVFSSAHNYSKVIVSVSDNYSLPPFGSVSVKASAGKIYGTLPYPFLEIHPGNDLYYYNPDAFNLMTRFRYISDRYTAFNVEHNIGSGLFRFLPLTRKLKWRQFWNAKAFWGSLTKENKLLNNTAYFETLNGSPYSEVGTGIDNIFRIIRIDFVWKILPKPVADNTLRFGVFGSLQFKF